MKEIMNGTACLAIAKIGNFVIELATNRFTPIGGVTNPIARFTTIITPKWIGSIPKPVAIGKKIGARIKIAGVVSIIIPTKSKNRLIINKSANFEVKVSLTKEAIS